MQAAALVQNELCCPVSIHPGRDPTSPDEVLRYFLEAGGRATSVAMCHLDRTAYLFFLLHIHSHFNHDSLLGTLIDIEDLFDFASMGSYLEFDLFGTECSHYQLDLKTDMPSDAQRVKYVQQLIVEGYEKKLLISHDIHTKHRLVT